MQVTKLACRKLLYRLRRDERGLSLLEFALIMPVILTLGLYGTEVAYMAMVDLQVAQLASSVADNSSRLGQTDNSSVTPTVTETQINSIMNGAMVQGAAFNFQANGRIILSSLEVDPSTSRQYIHWQRCKGNLAVTSKYGVAGAGKTGATLAGMGNSSRLITANANSAVMFVEVTYQYQPLFGTLFVSSPRFRQEAAFIIRDDRNLTPGVTGSGSTSAC